MGPFSLIGIVVVMLVPGLAVALVRWRRAQSGGPAAPLGPATIALRWSGAVGGVIVAVLLAQTWAFGGGFMLAAPVVCLGLLLGVIAGELVVGSPRTPVRAASIRVRRAVDYLPRRLTAAVATGSVALGIVLWLTTALGSPDDVGRSGRSLARSCDVLTSVAASPWPGSYYTAPLAAVLAAGLVISLLALRAIVRRPGAADVEDDARRSVSAEVVLGALGILVAVPAIGVSAVAAGQLLNFPCPAPSWAVVGWLLVAAMPAWLGLLVGSIASVIAPRNPVPVRELA